MMSLPKVLYFSKKGGDPLANHRTHRSVRDAPDARRGAAHPEAIGLLAGLPYSSAKGNAFAAHPFSGAAPFPFKRRDGSHLLSWPRLFRWSAREASFTLLGLWGRVAARSARGDGHVGPRLVAHLVRCSRRRRRRRGLDPHSPAQRHMGRCGMLDYILEEIYTWQMLLANRWLRLPAKRT